MSDLTVNINKVIHAPIEKVFDAWLNPSMLSKFILPMPGMPEPEVVSDAKKGGRFSIIMQVGEDKIPHTGTYLDVKRPDTLVFTWESPRSVDQSTVTLNFTALDEAKTNVELTHIKFINEETRTDHENGWGNILDKLIEVVSEPLAVV